MKRSIHSSSKEWDSEPVESHRESGEQTWKEQSGEEPAPAQATSSRPAEGDLWDEFVRENWAPTLQNDFGLDWRDEFSEEVIAILWWAVKHRNRIPGGTPSTSAGVAGSLPQMAGLPQAVSVGLASPVVGVHSQPPSSSPLVFGSFQAGSVGEGPVQGPFSGLPLFGAESAGNMGGAKSDGPPIGAIPIIPLDGFENSPCMDLPDIGDPPFANDEEEDVEGPSSKMQRLLEPSMDLSLNLEPVIDLTLDDHSDDDILGSDELVRAVMESKELLDHSDMVFEEEYDPESQISFEEEVKAPAPRPEKRKVKRSGGTKRQGDEINPVEQSSMGSVDVGSGSRLQGGGEEGSPRRMDRMFSAKKQAGPGFGALPGAKPGAESAFSLPMGSGMDVPYDPEHPGMGLGVGPFRHTPPPPAFGQPSGFTFASSSTASGDMKSVKFGSLGNSGGVHQGRPAFSSMGKATKLDMDSVPSSSFQSEVQSEPQKKAQKQRETDISGKGAKLQKLPRKEPPPMVNGDRSFQPGHRGGPQFPGVSTGQPITFGAQQSQSPMQGREPLSVAPELQHVGSPVPPPPGLLPPTPPMAGPSGASPLINQVLQPGYYSLYPTAAWGVAAPGGMSAQQMQQPVPMSGGTPLFCVPSTLPMQYGVPVPVMGLNQEGQQQNGSRGQPQPMTMPAMYVMDNRGAGHSLQHIVDGMDSLGRCPVHVAAMAGRSDIIDQLVHVGCDCSKVLPVDILAASKKKKQGETPAPPADPNSATQPPLPPPSTLQPPPPKKSVGKKKFGSVKASTAQAVQAKAATPMRVESDAGVDELSFKFCNALHLAAYYGHATVVDLLLNNNRCDAQARNEHGCTPLHFAANRGHRHIVSRLLKVQGMKIDLADMHGRTALHHGAAQGHADVIDELWPRGCKFDAVDVKGWTALHYAAHAGHTDVVSKLVIAGCPVTKFDNRGYTPAHLAAQGGYDGVLEKLLHAGYDPDTLGGMAVLRGCGGSTALHMAAAAGHANVVRQLLREGSSASKEDFRGFTALQCAAEGGHLEAFNVLLEAGCNPKAHDCCGTTVLHSAANGGNWDIIRELLDLGCDHSLQTKYGRTALHHAAQGGAYQVAQNLLNLGCDICVRDKDGNMPWHAAAEGGNLEVLELFLNKGCELEAKNNAGCTALHCAARSGSVGAVKALLDRGADITAVSGEGQTAMHYAAEIGHDEVVTLLLERLDKATINLQEATGWTVLHHAAKQGNKKIVKLLIDRDADVNTRTKEGWTALHLATRGHNRGVVEVLLNANCDTSIKDNDGCTALHYAAQRSNLPLFTLLFNKAGCRIGEVDNKGFTLLHYAVEGGNPEIVGTLLFTGAACSDNVEGSEKVMNALHLACKLGHAAVVSYLLKAGYKVNAKGPDAREPLHYAALGNQGMWGRKESTQQHFHVVKMLLESGADPHVLDKKGANPLMYAAGSGDLEMVFKFLTLGVDCKRTDENMWTAMHWAATSGNGDVVTQLLKSDVVVDAVDKKGRIPLHWAAERGHISSVTAILDVMIQNKVYIHKRDASGMSPVQLAASEGHVDVVAKLLESGKTKDVKGLTALHLAAQMKLEEVVNLLLSTGKCDVNARDAEGCTPLHYAAENGHSNIVGMLLDFNADMNITSSDGMMPIHKAASEGHLEAVNKLIEKGALGNFLTSSGSTPLHYAASTGKVSVLKRLIEAECPVNAMSTGSVSCTALYCAASNGQLDAVDLLLRHEAEVDTICTNDCTALHVAASNGHAEVVKRLLEAGADADLQAANGTAAIHNGVNNGHLDALEVLLAADCDVDVQNSGGNTALHIAASKGSLDLTKSLLNADCDVHIKNAKGWQAIHSAASNGFFEVVLLLVQHGAQWRQKGELDVAKLLCRKSNLKSSYVEGRLRLAEREKHRKAKPVETTEAAPTEEELKEKQAQADAIMLELLEEEAKKREQEEAREAKRKAKKDKKKKKKEKEWPKEDPKKEEGGEDETKVSEDEEADLGLQEVETIEHLAALSLGDTGLGRMQQERFQERKVRGKERKRDKRKEKERSEPVRGGAREDRVETVVLRKEARKEKVEGSGQHGAGMQKGGSGTIKIIRCHNTSTVVVNSARMGGTDELARSQQSKAVGKKDDADGVKVGVPKVKVPRGKRRGQSVGGSGSHDVGEANGLTGSRSHQRVASDVLPSKPAVAVVVPRPVVQPSVARGERSDASVAGSKAPPIVQTSAQPKPEGVQFTAGVSPAATKPVVLQTNVWNKPKPALTAQHGNSSGSGPRPPAIPSPSKPVAGPAPIPPPQSRLRPQVAASSAAGPSKPSKDLVPVLKSPGAPETKTGHSVGTHASPAAVRAPVFAPPRGVNGQAPVASTHPDIEAPPPEKIAVQSGPPRAWGPPGNIQGVRPHMASTSTGASAWSAPPNKRAAPVAASKPPEAPQVKVSADADLQRSSSVPQQQSSVSFAQRPGPTTGAVPRVGFPFPGRMEGWGMMGPGLPGSMSTPLLPGMHSGLGEQIIPPPPPTFQQGFDGPVRRPPIGEFGAMRFTGRVPTFSGDTSSGFYRRPAVEGSRVPDSLLPPWLNQAISHPGSFKGAAEAPFPGMGQRMPGTLSHDGPRSAKQVRLGGPVPEAPPWMQTSSAMASMGNGTLDAPHIPPAPKVTSRSSIINNIPDDPWEIGDKSSDSDHEPQPRMKSPRLTPVAPAKLAGQNQFCCPLTNKLMVDPVVAADGFTYERSAIEAWLAKNDKSPMTDKVLIHKDLVQNLTMRAAIQLLAPVGK